MKTKQITCLVILTLALFVTIRTVTKQNKQNSNQITLLKSPSELNNKTLVKTLEKMENKEIKTNKAKGMTFQELYQNTVFEMRFDIDTSCITIQEPMMTLE